MQELTHTQPAITFDDYVHYAAPKSSNIRTVFSPAAVTLGRNAFDRNGDQISDLEIVSCNGDRIPVSMAVLIDRWGKYFVTLLSRGYVRAVEDFESEKNKESKSKAMTTLKKADVPRFRIPFQESTESLGTHATKLKQKSISSMSTESQTSRDNSRVEGRRDSIPQHTDLFISHIDDVPPQLPPPNEPIPPVPSVPVSFKPSSRKGSQDASSPRASLMNTLSVLRNIPSTKSPRESPFSSPRASLSASSSNLSELRSSPFPNLRPNIGRSTSDLKLSSIDSGVEVKSKENETGSSAGHVSTEEEDDEEGADEDYHPLFAFEEERFPLEPSLIPRKLYMPFSTTTVKAFCEFFYTGQVGNKWVLAPTLLDNLIISKFYRVPLLYDLICEVLIDVIRRKESAMHKSEEYSQVIESIENGVISKKWLREICDDYDDESNDDTLAYLDVEDVNAPATTTRFKSVFDRPMMPIDAKSEEASDTANKINTMTVEDLVNPDSPCPSDEVIEVIHEAALLVTEMRIVLRTTMLMKLQRSR
ncbi:MDS3 [Candida theae]|uniref:MDS3 n=1 Tax=Candida theae TaxID=1198502 RepID=A0AAD5BGJ7_9ASCO|nr:MDS3 [Candida theae]KAI5961464.1 MDS3 [Candida theae]